MLGPRALAVGPHHCRTGQEAQCELWAQRGARPNHSEVRGPWQDKTTGKGQPRPSSLANPASESQAYSPCFDLPGLASPRPSDLPAEAMHFQTPLPTASPWKNYKSHDALLLTAQVRG